MAVKLRPAIAGQPAVEHPRQRVRIVYEKGERIKFIAHQDEFRAWERALRRADLPLLYKQGFNPQPHMQFASPLGVGFCGARELLDITFSPPLPLEELRERIAASLPPGLSVVGLREVELKAAPLQTLLIGADYVVTILAADEEIAPGEVERRIAAFLGTAEQWRTRERKGKSYRYNLRPLVYELAYRGYVAGQEQSTCHAESSEASGSQTPFLGFPGWPRHEIFLRVQQREGATGRPDEVVSALGLDGYARNLRRERLYFADSEQDAAVFAGYTVVTKEEISAVVAGGRGKRGRRRGGKGRAAEKRGRSISERAADEFD